MNRRDRRRAAKHGTWRNLPTELRQLSELDKVLPAADRQRLRRAADRLDAGVAPLVVLATIAPILNRVRKIAGGGGGHVSR